MPYASRSSDTRCDKKSSLGGTPDAHQRANNSQLSFPFAPRDILELKRRKIQCNPNFARLPDEPDPDPLREPNWNLTVNHPAETSNSSGAHVASDSLSASDDAVNENIPKYVELPSCKSSSSHATRRGRKRDETVSPPPKTAKGNKRRKRDNCKKIRVLILSYSTRSFPSCLLSRIERRPLLLRLAALIFKLPRRCVKLRLIRPKASSADGVVCKRKFAAT